VPQQKVLFVSQDDVCVLKVWGWFWSTADMQRLASVLSVHCDENWTAANAAVLRKSVRGAVNAFEVRPTLFILAGIGAVSILALVVYTVAATIHG
jgi:hypothetical protein